MHVAAAVPAYQASGTIAEVVRRTRPFVAAVLVVDDGSTDHTAEVARAEGAQVHSLPTNSGKGAALLAAFQILFAQGFAAVVTLDADGQHLPEEIPRLLDAFASAEVDLVLGTRDHLFHMMGLVRCLSNSISSWLISWLAGIPLSDVQTGFRVYSERLVRLVGFPERRFEAESAVVVRAARLGLRIATVPVELGTPDGRRTSHYRPFADSLRIARAVLRARWPAGG